MPKIPANIVPKFLSSVVIQLPDGGVLTLDHREVLIKEFEAVSARMVRDVLAGNSEVMLPVVERSSWELMLKLQFLSEAMKLVVKKSRRGRRS